MPPWPRLRWALSYSWRACSCGSRTPSRPSSDRLDARAALARRIENEARRDLAAARVDERRLARLAGGHQRAQLGRGQPLARGLKPHDEPAPFAPARAAPAARAGDQRPLLATRAGEGADVAAGGRLGGTRDGGRRIARVWAGRTRVARVRARGAAFARVRVRGRRVARSSRTRCGGALPFAAATSS